MQLTSLFPPTQAFSYLSSKGTLSRKKKFLRNGLTITGLLIIAGIAMCIQFPQKWMQSQYTTATFFIYPALLLFLAIKAFFIMESGGYLIHRYFEHLGFMTRRSRFFREGQKYHWAHHMIIYPLNKQYIKGTHYIDSQNYGLAWHWILPLILTVLLAIYVMGWKIETMVLIAMMVGYARLVELVHARFHIFGHPWEKDRYFMWLADIHVLHHFDQETNFSMVVPLMDLLFGTYLSPKGDFQRVKAFMKNNDLNSADFINWHYLLTEATPVEYARYIGAIQKHPGMLKKAQGMLKLLEQFQPTDFYYPEAQKMKNALQEFSAKIPSTFHDDSDTIQSS